MHLITATASESLDWCNYEAIDEIDNTADDIESFPYDADFETATEIDINESIGKPKNKRGRRHFLTSRLLSALDNAKVSDGMAVHILIAAAEALGHRVEELVINRSTINRLRHLNRINESKEIQADFDEVISK